MPCRHLQYQERDLLNLEGLRLPPLAICLSYTNLFLPLAKHCKIKEARRWCRHTVRDQHLPNVGCMVENPPHSLTPHRAMRWNHGTADIDTLCRHSLYSCMGTGKNAPPILLVNDHQHWMAQTIPDRAVICSRPLSHQPSA